MKPAWDKLIAEYKDSNSALVADVDCTAAGKDLCETHGVEGFPTIKWGDPSDLQDYEGERELKALKKFAKENLKPMCSPANIDLCDADKKKDIEDFRKKGAAELDNLITAGEAEMKEVESNFTAQVEKLQSDYEKLEKGKKETLEAIKESGLGLMKAVRKSKQDAKEEL